MFENIIEKHINKAGDVCQPCVPTTETGSSAVGIAGVVAANIVDDAKEFTIPVALPEEGQASILNIFGLPESFTPGESFYFSVQITNLGARDTIFFRIIDRDTEEVLYEKTQVLNTGDVWQQYLTLRLTQTTDFHGRVDAGHEE